jgi:hypothetical protein
VSCVSIDEKVHLSKSCELIAERYVQVIANFISIDANSELIDEIGVEKFVIFDVTYVECG